MNSTTIGLDIAINVFQVHGVDAHGKVTLRKQLKRSQVLAFFANLPPCRIGLEACAGAHYWVRELIKLGHDARLISPQFVKPYVKGGNRTTVRGPKNSRGTWNIPKGTSGNGIIGSISSVTTPIINVISIMFNVNPLKHGCVKQVADWPYSTFHLYVAKGIYPLVLVRRCQFRDGWR